MAEATPDATTKPNGSPVAGLLIPGLLIVAAGVIFTVFYLLNPKTPPVDAAKLLNGYVLNADKVNKLAQEYKDTNGDMVADTPADPKEPAELFFTEIPGPNPDADEKTWAAFLEHMSKATGKPCKYLKKVDGLQPAGDPADATGESTPPPSDAGAVKSFNTQLSALKGGHLHITAFSTGQVRQAVNTAGFRPLVAPADKGGKSVYQVKILVPAGSPTKELKDLRGKTLAVSSFSSHSGAKVPFLLFKEQGGLDPRSDYKIKVTGNYWVALAQLAKGEVDAVGIAGDLLARELARGEPTETEKAQGRVKLTEDKFRVIHTSADTPKLCFGVSHTLPQPLVDKIQKGFEEFKFDGTAVQEKYKADGVVKFQAVDYKKDWQDVRAVDDRLIEFLKAK